MVLPLPRRDVDLTDGVQDLSRELERKIIKVPVPVLH